MDANAERILAEAYRNLDPYKPLAFPHEFWVDLDQGDVRGCDKCAETLTGTVNLANLSGETARLLFAGYNGGGKTTVLNEAKRRLEDAGYTPIYIDVQDYLSLEIPVESFEIALAIAAGLDDHFDSLFRRSTEAVKRIWDRFSAILNAEIDLKEIGVSLPSGVNLKTEIKTNVPLRQLLREKIDRKKRQSSLVAQCHSFADEVVAFHRNAVPASKGIVILLDNLERLGGKERTIRESLIDVFRVHAEDLMFHCHTIYSVPTWMRFVHAGKTIAGRFDKRITLPMCKVRDRESKQPSDKGLDRLMTVLRKRANLKALFGDDNPPFLRELAYLSGGCLRDLFRMVRGVVNRAFVNGADLPVRAELQKKYADAEAVALTQDYENSLFQDAIKWLAQVEAENDIPDNLGSQDLDLMIEWFDNHFILSYHNGGAWCDVHPLLKERSRRYRRLKETINGANDCAPAE